jgi:hypothetical protein
MNQYANNSNIIKMYVIIYTYGVLKQDVIYCKTLLCVVMYLPQYNPPTNYITVMDRGMAAVKMKC